MTPFIIAGSVCLLGAVIISLTRRPSKKLGITVGKSNDKLAAQAA
jgi:hypothetical protein